MARSGGAGNVEERPKVGAPAPPSAGGVLPGPRRRRQPKLVVLAVVLVAMGALGSVLLATGLGDRVSVVAVAAQVSSGDPIQRGDLVQARVSADPALQPIPWSEVDAILGMFAATNLVPGSLLTLEQVTAEQLPPDGMQLVGVAVPAGQLPATPLLAGDRVLLIPVALSESGLAADQGSPIEATVVRVGPVGVDGSRVVDVLVDDAEGRTVAGLSAGGLLAIVLVSRG